MRFKTTAAQRKAAREYYWTHKKPALAEISRQIAEADEQRSAEREAMHARWLAWQEANVLRCKHYPAGVCCGRCHSDSLYGMRLIGLTEGRYAYVCCQKVLHNITALEYLNDSHWLLSLSHGGIARTPQVIADTATEYDRNAVAKLPAGLLRSHLERLAKL